MAENAALPVRKLSPQQFMAATLGSQPCRIDTRRCAGHPFDCACGGTHPYRRETVPVLRQLGRRSLLVACPEGRPFMTCVRLRGVFGFSRFESVFGAELVGPAGDRAHETLGVSPKAPQREVRSAYLDLVKVWHPDRFEDDQRLRGKAEQKLREITAAYHRIREGPPRNVAPARTENAAPEPETAPAPITTAPIHSGEILSKFRLRLA